MMNYKVEVDQSGRGGRISYIENERALSLDWEFATRGHRRSLLVLHRTDRRDHRSRVGGAGGHNGTAEARRVVGGRLRAVSIPGQRLRAADWSASVPLAIDRARSVARQAGRLRSSP